MKFNSVLIGFAFLLGILFGNIVLDPTFTLQVRIIAVFSIFGFAFMFSYCSSMLEKLDEDLFEHRINLLFGEDENES